MMPLQKILEQIIANYIAVGLYLLCVIFTVIFYVGTRPV